MVHIHVSRCLSVTKDKLLQFNLMTSKSWFHFHITYMYIPIFEIFSIFCLDQHACISIIHIYIFKSILRVSSRFLDYVLYIVVSLINRVILPDWPGSDCCPGCTGNCSAVTGCCCSVEASVHDDVPHPCLQGHFCYL